MVRALHRGEGHRRRCKVLLTSLPGVGLVGVGVVGGLVETAGGFDADAKDP